MGHERVGTLPRTRRWRDVVAAIAPVARGEATVERLAQATLKNVRNRYNGLHRDTGVQAAFGFLVSVSAKGPSGGRHGLASADIARGENPSLLEIVGELHTWVRSRTASPEHAAIAEKAAADAIVEWARGDARQTRLFAISSQDVAWQRAATAPAFCEIARIFFAKFTERYLVYFVGREAAAEVGTVEERRALDQAVTRHVDLVSRHAFETAKITQSFAAGWYNSHVVRGRPSDRELEAFLAVAFGKLREELLRESAP
jgi:hypothetical protein